MHLLGGGRRGRRSSLFAPPYCDKPRSFHLVGRKRCCLLVGLILHVRFFLIDTALGSILVRLILQSCIGLDWKGRYSLCCAVWLALGGSLFCFGLLR